MTAVPPPPWEIALAHLLAPTELGGGGELAVYDDNDDVVFRAPLARHFRIDLAAGVVWVRPVVGGSAPLERRTGEPSYRFSLNAARRRALPVEAVEHRGEELVFALADGGRAHVHPIGDDLRPELDRWDTFVLATLPADVERALDGLDDDSWNGPWA